MSVCEDYLHSVEVVFTQNYCQRCTHIGSSTLGIASFDSSTFGCLSWTALILKRIDLRNELFRERVFRVRVFAALDEPEKKMLNKMNEKFLSIFWLINTAMEVIFFAFKKRSLYCDNKLYSVCSILAQSMFSSSTHPTKIILLYNYFLWIKTASFWRCTIIIITTS